MKNKYKVGDELKDTYSSKKGIVTRLYLSPTDEYNRSIGTWYYSIDSMGWYFYPESELELITEG